MFLVRGFKKMSAGLLVVLLSLFYYQSRYYPVIYRLFLKKQITGLYQRRKMFANLYIFSLKASGTG